jgi:hypothetical protein
MLSGSITMSDYSRNLIIASNLANEQVELFKNVRDSNYSKVKYWIQINPSDNLDWSVLDSNRDGKLDDNYDEDKIFKKGFFYKIENNYNA